MSATVTVVGELSKDAEEKSGKTGNLYAILNVIHRYTPFGRDEQFSNYYNCVCFGDLAKKYGQLPKGSVVVVSGPLEASTRKSENGDKTYLNLSVTANSVELIAQGEEVSGDPGDDLPF